MRTAISVGVLGFGLWAAFAVELGDKTFAEHIDTISETPEAKQLVEDTRETVNPALAEVRDRVLGEYVEAPTWISDPEFGREHAEPASASTVARRREAHGPREPDGEPLLPGWRSAAQRESEDLEPALPGRR